MTFTDVSLDGMPEIVAPDPVEPAPAVPPKYGYLRDGVTPKKAPGRPRKARANSAGPKVPPAPKAKAGGAAEPVVSPYAEKAAGPLSGLAYVLAQTGHLLSNPVLIADGIAVKDATPAVSAALGDLAEQDARIAGLLDRIAATGPYTAIFAALMPLGLQIARNHGVGIAAAFGAEHPIDLLVREGIDPATYVRPADHDPDREPAAAGFPV